jgi:hypothetical protein
VAKKLAAQGAGDRLRQSIDEVSETLDADIIFYSGL